uniref:RxLR effector candidate protein n=1 Tax=Hyaloperonospora arabidopsidis (strain Emoy2) TaxID=559515 RepID=M4B211_HYAAE|nr:RxLR effector candidate protein [Hyaloperonospora arabidopsidis Emoy2]
MRLHPLALLASTAVPTGAMAASGVTGPPIVEGNSVAGAPPFFPDSDDNPGHVPVIEQNTTKDEERTSSELPPQKAAEKRAIMVRQQITSDVLNQMSGGSQKTQKDNSVKEMRQIALAAWDRMVGTRETSGTTGREQITPDVWKRMIREIKKIDTKISNPDSALSVWDEMIRTSRVLVNAAEVPLSTRGPPLLPGRADVKDLHAFAESVAKPRRHKKDSEDIISWMEGEAQEKLVDVLILHRFVPFFTFRKVKLLDKYLESDEGKLFKTLVTTWGSLSEFTTFLSIAKLKPSIEKSQRRLLKLLLTKEVPITRLIEALNIQNKDLTYETLDILVEFVALRDEKTLCKSIGQTLKELKDHFDPKKVKETSKNEKGKTKVQRTTLHQGGLLESTTPHRGSTINPPNSLGQIWF